MEWRTFWKSPYLREECLQIQHSLTQLKHTRKQLAQHMVAELKVRESRQALRELQKEMHHKELQNNLDELLLESPSKDHIPST